MPTCTDSACSAVRSLFHNDTGDRRLCAVRRRRSVLASISSKHRPLCGTTRRCGGLPESAGRRLRRRWGSCGPTAGCERRFSLSAPDRCRTRGASPNRRRRCSFSPRTDRNFNTGTYPALENHEQINAGFLARPFPNMRADMVYFQRLLVLMCGWGDTCGSVSSCFFHHSFPCCRSQCGPSL